MLSLSHSGFFRYLLIYCDPAGFLLTPSGSHSLGVVLVLTGYCRLCLIITASCFLILWFLLTHLGSEILFPASASSCLLYVMPAGLCYLCNALPAGFFPPSSFSTCPPTAVPPAAASPWPYSRGRPAVNSPGVAVRPCHPPALSTSGSLGRF